MFPTFSRSDDFFVSLVHNQTKRTSAIAVYQKKRKMYFWIGILYGVLAFPCLFFTDARLSIMFFACFVLFMSIHAYFDNKVKLLLYIEEEEKVKQGA